MSFLLSQILAILPWGFGIVMLYVSVPQYYQNGLGLKLMMIGTACFLGYLSIAMQLWLLNHLEVVPFSPWLLPTSAVILAICALVRKMLPKELCSPAPTPFDSSHKISTILIFFLSLIVITFVGYEILLRPALAWDTLAHWSFGANRFLTDGLYVDEGGPYNPDSVHPKTIIYILAWGGWSASITDPFRLAPFIPWLHIYLAISMSIFGLFLHKTKSVLISAVFAYIFLSTPIVEAHASLGGYAELWIGFPLLLAIFFFHEYAKTQQIGFLLLAIICSISPTSIKGVGSFYTLIIFTIFLLTPVVNKWGRPVIVTVTSLVLITIFSLPILNFDVSIFGIRIAVLAEKKILFVAGREVLLVTNDWVAALSNLYYSLLKNNSFGVHFWVVLLSYAHTLILLFFKKHLDIFPLLALFTSILAVLFCAQIFSDYFFRYSNPGHDSSLTRAAITLFLVSFPLIATSFEKLVFFARPKNYKAII